MLDPGAHYVGSLDGDKLEALIETMYLVAFADGAYGPSERAHFEKSVGVLTDGKLAGEDFDHVVTRLSDALRRQGRDGCIASLKQRLDEPQLRQIALILAADMAAADGVLHPEERAVVLAMARAFGVGEDAAREVLDGPPS
ncbi:MAG: tellurite resistance TerB family protein [Polyangiaceae bacterium]